MRDVFDRVRHRMRAFADTVRVDTAVLLAIVVTLLAYPNEVVGFLCDLFAIP
jgi:hypothetical protein